MAFTTWAAKVLDDVWGYLEVNIVRSNELYLKTQSEVLVAEGATAIKDAVVPRNAALASNAAIEGAKLVSRAAATGNQTFEETLEDEVLWALKD